MDTGAKVTVITERLYKALGSPTVINAGRVLRDPDQTKLKLQGKVRVILTR